MRNYKTEGIIIKRRNYKDSDRVLTVLTKTHGKIYVRASGVRKIISRRAAHIELLNHSTLSLYQGSSFPILTEATTLNNYSSIKNDLGNIGLALHLCELVDGLCPENQENIRVFFLLKETLGKITNNVIPELVGDPSNVDSRSSSLTIRPRAHGREGIRADGLRGNDRLINEFERQLLTILGYLPAGRQAGNTANFAQAFDTQDFIENILERKLKSRNVFAKM